MKRREQLARVIFRVVGHYHFMRVQIGGVKRQNADFLAASEQNRVKMGVGEILKNVQTRARSIVARAHSGRRARRGFAEFGGRAQFAANRLDLRSSERSRPQNGGKFAAQIQNCGFDANFAIAAIQNVNFFAQ